MTQPNWMIYGASGYTGALLAEEAVRRGHNPVLAGRSAARLSPLAARLGLEWLAISLDDPAALRRALQPFELVLHAAGPFVVTSRPMVQACLERGAHYLDITGEIPVFQHTFSCDAAARERHVALISGCGFDVVPSDCLAQFVAAQAPGATGLEIALAGLGRASAGTAKSMLEMLPGGGLVRRDGRLVPFPMGQGAKRVRFSDRERSVLPIPWGDLETSYHDTGIPNITTFMAFPSRSLGPMRLLAPLGQSLLAVRPLRRVLAAAAGRFISGPDENLRQTGHARLWARAYAPGGSQAEAWLETVEAYRFTALSGVRLVEKVLEQRPTGALTPAQAFGADFVLEIEGTRRIA